MYAGFSKGGAGNLRILMIKRKVSLLRFSPVFGPKLGEDQKKKKQVSSQILSVYVLKLCAKLTKGGGVMPHFCISFYANYTFLATQKVGHGTIPPPKHAPA